MIALLVALTLSAAPDCGALAPVEFSGRVWDAALHGCSAVVLTGQALVRVGPGGEVERTVKGRFAGQRLTLDPERDRLFRVRAEHGDAAVTVIIEARSLSTLDVLPTWGQAGELRLLARRKTVKPRHSAGGDAAVALRPDGSLLVVTRADGVDSKISVLSSWRVSAEGEAAEPVVLRELDSGKVSGDVLLALAPDGRGLLAFTQEGGAQVVGLAADGTLDPRFGKQGFLTEPQISFPIAAHMDAGQWVLTGTHGSAYRVVAARYQANGVLDPSFGTRGTQVINPAAGALEHPRAMTPLHDGTIAIAGVRFWRKEERARPTLIVLTRAGALREVKQLELRTTPQVDLVRVFARGDRLVAFGYAGATMTDAKANSFWQELEVPGRRSDEPPQTMYRWLGSDGVEGFATSLEEVPAKYRSAAKPFTP